MVSFLIIYIVQILTKLSSITGCFWASIQLGKVWGKVVMLLSCDEIHRWTIPVVLMRSSTISRIINNTWDDTAHLGVLIFLLLFYLIMTFRVTNSILVVSWWVVLFIQVTFWIIWNEVVTISHLNLIFFFFLFRLFNRRRGRSNLNLEIFTILRDILRIRRYVFLLIFLILLHLISLMGDVILSRLLFILNPIQGWLSEIDLLFLLRLWNLLGTVQISPSSLLLYMHKQPIIENSIPFVCGLSANFLHILEAEVFPVHFLSELIKLTLQSFDGRLLLSYQIYILLFLLSSFLLGFNNFIESGN